MLRSLTFTKKKVKIEAKILIDFLKLVNKRASLGLFAGYKVFSLFQNIGGPLKSDITYTANQPIILKLNIQWLVDILKFCDNFVKEIGNLKYHKSLSENHEVMRCTQCNVIIPFFFILGEEYKSPFVFKPFYEKVKNKEFFGFSKIIKSDDFNTGQEYPDLIDLKKELSRIYDKLVHYFNLE